MNCICTVKPSYIKYDPIKDTLYLREGYPIAYGMDHSKDKIIFEIKSKTDLIKAYNLYFSEIKKSLKQISLDKFIKIYCGNDEDMIEEAGGEIAIKKFYDSFNKSINSIRL